MTKQIYLYLIVLLCASCKSGPDKQVNFRKNAAKTGITSTCFSHLDTTFANGDYVKYVKADSGTDIEVRLHNALHRVVWGFPCNLQGSLVPIVCKYNDSIIILTRGTGFHFREAFVFELEGEGIKESRYETTLLSHAPNNCFVYLKHDKHFISILNKLYKTVHGADDEIILNEKTIPLPDKYQKDSLLGAEVDATSITLKFLENGSLEIPNRKVDVSE